jgi:hypothetical protein
MAVLTILAGIHLSKLLHDAVPSTVRSGVASGVSALSWMAFLPVALVAGAVIDGGGTRSAGWLVLATAILTGVLLIGLARRSARSARSARPGPSARLMAAAEPAACAETMAEPELAGAR